LLNSDRLYRNVAPPLSILCLLAASGQDHSKRRKLRQAPHRQVTRWWGRAGSRDPNAS